jgi:hypothetical protein
MNEIYWQEKRTMASQQFSSSPPIQSKHLYQNTFQTKNYPPIDNRFKAYSTVANRSYNNICLPYASSAYGVYRRIPNNLKGPPSMYTNPNRHIDIRDRPHYSQQRQLPHNIRNNYNYSKYQEINDLFNAIYCNENENDDDDDDDDNNEENCSDIFNYTFPTTGVSFF